MSPAEAPLRLGIDAVDIERFRRVLARRPTLRSRLFAEQECKNSDGTPRSVESLAARFAAKEATMKVLGVGVGGVSFRSIAVRSSATGEPVLELSGRAAELATAKGLSTFSCSLTHTKMMAMAVVGSVHN